MKRALYVLTFIVWFIVSCNKDSNDEPAPAAPVKGLSINLKFNVDGASLVYDSILYQNAAGNPYSVSRLQFYLSDFEFVNSAGTTISIDTTIYVDARNAVNTRLRFPDFPFGDYIAFKFNIGVDPAHNVTGGLPNTLENTNMAWPDFMGGGYHFMKFEGDYRDQSVSYGYAMHLGTNDFLVHEMLLLPFTINSNNYIVDLSMNLNEWFEHPMIYDFNVDGNYSMADSAAMTKLTINGVDVFSLQP